MNIFNGIPTDRGYDSIRDAVVAVVHKARVQNLQESPWSLVELQSDNDDYFWLCDWLRHLSSGVAYRCLEEGQWRKFDSNELTFSYSVGIGTLLLMSAVEIARREATLQSLWAAIYKRQSESYPRLFLQGHPTRAYKDAIEQAARWLNLRHVFGIEGMQNWYDTISLQFGFSNQGFIRRLPEWLAGQGQTLSIQLLTGKMQSATFCALWEGLKQFRRKNWNEAQLRILLSKNPWVLPEWADDLIKQAQKKLELGTDSVTIASAQDDEIPDPFLSKATLRWDGSQPPRFLCSVINLAGMDLQENTYDIFIAGQICGYLSKNSEGHYSVFPTDTIEIPVIAPQVSASLIAPNGQLVQSHILHLWDGAEDVTTFYESSGQQFDPWKTRLRPERGIFLLLRDDLSLEPEVPWYALNQQGVKLYYLPPGWSTQTRVILDGQEFWHPYLITPPMREASQALTAGIQVHIYKAGGNYHFFGESVRFIITLPDGVGLSFLRSGGQALAFTLLNDSLSLALTEPIAITPSVFSTEDVCRIEVLLGIRVGSTRTSLYRTVEFPIAGAAILSSQGWTALRPDDALELEQIRMQPVKTFVKDVDQWALMEGDMWIGRLWKTPRPLVSLSGFGAPLKLSKGVYNLVDDPLVLAREIIDQGNLIKVDIDAPDKDRRTLRIQLSRIIDVDKHHAIYWWDQTGTFQTLVPKESERQGEAIWWLASLPQELTEPLAIAFAYNGIRLGTWWSEDWNFHLNKPMQQSPQTIAALLRWLHLPLLSQHYQDDIQSFAFTFPGETLAAWVGDSGLPEALHFGDLDDGWLSAIRAIFWPWQPTDVPITQIISLLIPGDLELNPGDWLPVIAWKLLRVSPLLMGRIVNQWIHEVGVPQWGPRNVSVLLKQLIYELAEAESSSQELDRKITLLEEHVAGTMKVDSAFVEKALIQRAVALFQGQPIRHLDQENLAVAMNVEPFRRLLGIKVLEAIDHMIEVRRAG